MVKNKTELTKRIQRAKNLHFGIYGEKLANFLAFCSCIFSIFFRIFNDLQVYSLYLTSGVSTVFGEFGQ